MEPTMKNAYEFPTIDELMCLNIWTEGTFGYENERQVIQQLLNLCNEFGFGRVPQIAQAIEDIWRHPDKIKEYQKARDERMTFLNQRNHESTKITEAEYQEYLTDSVLFVLKNKHRIKHEDNPEILPWSWCNTCSSYHGDLVVCVDRTWKALK
jgi:hypothetical protein